MVTTAKVKPFAPGTRVVVVRDRRGASEGTPGRVRVANGLTWLRYWIEFDTGAWIGSIDHGDLVAEGEWEAYKARRVEAAARAAEAPAEQDVAPGPAPSPEATAPASKVPAHLLERSQRARERRAAGG